MKPRELLLSKWFYYSLTALALLVLIFFALPYWRSIGVISRELELDLFSECWGLLFTLLIFVMLFELRDKLDWKSVEGKVTRMIDRRLDAIFNEVSLLCNVSMVVFGGISEEAFKKRRKEELERLAKNVELNQSTIDEIFEKRRHDLALELATVLDQHRMFLSEIEVKYSKFLHSKLQTALMEIQEYLYYLRYELRVIPTTKERFCKDLSEVIGKILKAMVEAKKRLS